MTHDLMFANAAPPCSKSLTDILHTLSPSPACSGLVTPIPSTPGWITSTTTDSRVYWPISTVATVGGDFSDRQQLKQEIQERLHQGPQPLPCPPPTTAPNTVPNHWTLDWIRASFEWMAGYSTSGVWRSLERLGLRLRSAKVQQFSPDPEYTSKLLDLEMVLWEARRYPRTVTAVFMDQMGFNRWPDPGKDWGSTPPLADRRGAKERKWRLIGALNPLTGQVDYLDAYIVGRAKVINFYEQLVAAYPQVRRLYVIQDNWSIHSHPDVMEALQAWPQVTPVWLPTYAPWLNPIEKLWRWLRQEVLKLHRWADDWETLLGRVRAFLEQFAHGSERLLEYVGLLGSGRLAQMIHGP